MYKVNYLEIHSDIDANGQVSIHEFQVALFYMASSIIDICLIIPLEAMRC